MEESIRNVHCGTSKPHDPVLCSVVRDTEHYHSRVAAEVDESRQVMGVKVLLSH